MGVDMRAFAGILLLLGTVALSRESLAAYDDLSAGRRAGYTTLAVVENVVPIASTFATPRCLQGYIVCKFTFAMMSLLVAGEQLVMSGGSDLDQTRGLLHRGFAGDWYVTGRHASGDLQPQLLPDPAPAAPAPDAGSGSAEPAPDAGSAKP
jgi:hypothetical protein